MSALRQSLKHLLTGLLPRHVLATHGSGAGLALTFDDGPHPEHTPQLLDALGAAGIPATFFLVGERADRHRDILQRIAAEGHEIGNHTWSHSEPCETSTRQLINEVRRTRDLIEDVSGRECRLFRPPKGELTPRKLLALRRERQTIVLWNQDTKDYRMTTGSEAMRNWYRKYQPTPGDIVLMHDNHPHAIEAIRALQEHHPQWPDRCRTVSQLLHLTYRDFTAAQTIKGTLCTGS
ncbi:MAG: polysaccharide deacetylase family protein [Planctomycetota bacterium]|jgi:peptidoglycan/xylan/chitin deacetylase (PgdA/CDA1 family)